MVDQYTASTKSPTAPVAHIMCSGRIVNMDMPLQLVLAAETLATRFAFECGRRVAHHMSGHALFRCELFTTVRAGISGRSRGEGNAHACVGGSSWFGHVHLWCVVVCRAEPVLPVSRNVGQVSRIVGSKKGCAG